VQETLNWHRRVVQTVKHSNRARSREKLLSQSSRCSFE
jgi:hypothetical protein